MLSTDNMQDAFNNSANLIDLLEASDAIGTKGKAWLAVYQTKMGSNNTTLGEDLQLMKYLEQYIRHNNPYAR